MKVISSRLPSRRVKCAATIGVFDGIHLGHQFILRKLRESAKRTGLASLVITFDIPPQQFLSKKKLTSFRFPGKIFTGSLTNKDEKTALIKASGIDYLWFLKTRRSLLGLPAQDFVNYVQQYFRVEKIIVGEDFRFGHKGGGDLKVLKSLGSKHEFSLSIVKKLVKEKKVVSSSLIRQYIQRGWLSKAEQLLGRKFSLTGRVFKGKGIGRGLGFPTANVSISEYITPALGVYAAYVILGKGVYLSAVNVGPVIEAHILNFKRNILGKTIKIIFLEKIREEKKFPSLKVLRAAISKDTEYIASKYSASKLPYPQPLVV